MGGISRRCTLEVSNNKVIFVLNMFLFNKIYINKKVRLMKKFHFINSFQYLLYISDIEGEVKPTDLRSTSNFTLR